MKKYNPADFVETQAGNKFSRKSVLCGAQNISLGGKTILDHGVVVRGDFQTVRMGKYCVIQENVVIRPPYKSTKRGHNFFPVTVGNHVMIEEQSVVEAVALGSFVHIGKNCVIGKRCILKDCCRIADNSILAPDTVVPPFTEFAGVPALYSKDLPECFQDIMKDVKRDQKSLN